MDVKTILAVAAAQLGTTEQPPNSNAVKYNTAYYGREVFGGAYPWCCAFVWWVFRAAGAAGLFFGGGKTASCSALCAFHRGQAVTDYKPGDVVFFDFSGQRKKTEHVGIVESVETGYVTTIDGNTGTSNEANGGAVMRRRRAVKYVSGGFRPNYEEESGMTKEEIKGLIQSEIRLALADYEADQAKVRNRPVDPCADKAWAKAKAAGVMDGTRPAGPLLRQECAMIIDRLGLLDGRGV